MTMAKLPPSTAELDFSLLLPHSAYKLFLKNTILNMNSLFNHITFWQGQFRYLMLQSSRGISLFSLVGIIMASTRLIRDQMAKIILVRMIWHYI